MPSHCKGPLPPPQLALPAPRRSPPFPPHACFSRMHLNCSNPKPAPGEQAAQHSREAAAARRGRSSPKARGLRGAETLPGRGPGAPLSRQGCCWLCRATHRKACLEESSQVPNPQIEWGTHSTESMSPRVEKQSWRGGAEGWQAGKGTKAQ